jgi:iron complex transport system substrate-binding protein
MTPRTTRRRFVAGAGALASLPALLAACGSDEESESAADQGGFSFTDDRGQKVTLDGRPERIVMHEYAAVALWDYGLRPIGIYASQPFDKQPLFKDMDLGDVESLGEVWGEVNLEALAALRPDINLTTYWPTDKSLGGIKDAKLEEKMSAIAPIVGIDAQAPADTTIDHFEKLAAALGADVEAEPVVAARKRYKDSIERLRAAVEAKPGLRVMPVYADPELLYIGKWNDYSDLKVFESEGVEFVPAKSSKPYWEELSWENADKYPADLILWDARATSPRPEKLAEIPGWQRLPAVEAGQLSPWRMEEGVSYKLFASHVEELAGAIERARVLDG